MDGLKMVAWWLMVIGGINWGLVGLGGLAGGDWNVVHMALGAWPMVEWIVYLLVGVSTVWSIFNSKKSTSPAMV